MLCADAMAFSGLVGGDEISQLFDNGVNELLLVPFVFTELSEHVVLAAGVLHPAHKIHRKKMDWFLQLGHFRLMYPQN